MGVVRSRQSGEPFGLGRVLGALSTSVTGSVGATSSEIETSPTLEVPAQNAVLRTIHVKKEFLLDPLACCILEN